MTAEYFIMCQPADGSQAYILGSSAILSSAKAYANRYRRILYTTGAQI